MLEVILSDSSGLPLYSSLQLESGKAQLLSGFIRTICYTLRERQIKSQKLVEPDLNLKLRFSYSKHFFSRTNDEGNYKVKDCTNPNRRVYLLEDSSTEICGLFFTDKNTKMNEVERPFSQFVKIAKTINSRLENDPNDRLKVYALDKINKNLSFKEISNIGNEVLSEKKKRIYEESKPSFQAVYESAKAELAAIHNVEQLVYVPTR